MTYTTYVLSFYFHVNSCSVVKTQFYNKHCKITRVVIKLGRGWLVLENFVTMFSGQAIKSVVKYYISFALVTTNMHGYIKYQNYYYND